MLQPAALKPVFANTLQVDLENEKTSNLKTLLNFKKVVVVGGWRELRGSVLKSVREKTNPSKIYLVEDQQAEEFLKEYPMLGAQGERAESKQLPVLLLDSEDFAEANRPASRLRIFAHPSAVMNKVYSALGIKEGDIIEEPVG